MPVKNSKLRPRDPFVMNEDRVNQLVANFFKSRGFDSFQYLSGKETGIDVQAEKSGWRAYVESKGSQANHHDEDTVFDTSQIKVHTYNQNRQINGISECRGREVPVNFSQSKYPSYQRKS